MGLEVPEAEVDLLEVAGDPLDEEVLEAAAVFKEVEEDFKEAAEVSREALEVPTMLIMNN